MTARTESRGSRELQTGDSVLARNYGAGNKWTGGIVESVLGSRHYNVDIGHSIVKCHIDQLHKNKASEADHLNENLTQDPNPGPESREIPVIVEESSASMSTDTSIETVPSGACSPKKTTQPSPLVPVSEKRYPDQIRDQPDNLKDYSTK